MRIPKFPLCRPGGSRLFLGIALLSWLCLARSTLHAQFLEVAPRLQGFSLTSAGPVRPGESGDFSEPIAQEYGLRALTRWEIQPGPGSLSVYEMADTQAAFGFYSIWQREAREGGTNLNLEPDNLRLRNRLATWGGHYFFVIDWSGKEQLLQDFVVQLTEAVGEESLHPLTVLHLPTQGLVANSVRFYLGPKALAADDALPEQLISELGFSDEVEACTAQYGADRETLLLLAYPNPSVADNYGARIQDALQSVIAHDGIYMKRSGPLLGLFLGSRQGAQEVLGALQYKARVKWVHDPNAQERQAQEDRAEIVSFFGVVSSSIVFTGFFILAVLGLGLVAGLIRFVAVQKFPALTHRDETIVLDLGSADGDREG